MDKKKRFQSPPPADPITAVRESSLAFRLNTGFFLRQLGISAALTCEERINTLTGDPEELFHLGRFNRPHGKPLEQILAAAQTP